MIQKDDFAALTGIRGVAAWWIVLFHFNEYLSPLMNVQAGRIIDRGYLAVDLFFELSGFIIALNYAEWFRAPRLSQAAKFLGIRLARIYPLHAFMLLLFLLNPLVIVLFSHRSEISHNYDIGYFILSVFLVQNWGLTSSLAWNVPAWSISTEWAAYLTFPLMTWICLRIIRTRAHAFVLMSLLVCVLASAFAIMDLSLGGGIPQTGLLRCLVEFWMGMCLYFFWRQKPVGPAYANVSVLLAAILLAAYVAFRIPDFVLVPSAFLLLIFGLTQKQCLLSRVMASTPLKFLGAVSYSTYLVHYFVKDWVKFTLVRGNIPAEVPVLAYLAITASASLFLYYYVEVSGRSTVRQWIMSWASPGNSSRMREPEIDSALAAQTSDATTDLAAGEFFTLEPIQGSPATD